MKRNKKTIIIVVITLVLIILGYVSLQNYTVSNKECFDIIGDGYAMGTDPKPVVIGNSCDK